MNNWKAKAFNTRRVVIQPNCNSIPDQCTEVRHQTKFCLKTFVIYKTKWRAISQCNHWCTNPLDLFFCCSIVAHSIRLCEQEKREDWKGLISSFDWFIRLIIHSIHLFIQSKQTFVFSVKLFLKDEGNDTGLHRYVLIVGNLLLHVQGALFERFLGAYIFLMSFVLYFVSYQYTTTKGGEIHSHIIFTWLVTFLEWDF